ncbi:hypothetical protein MTF68_00015 [Pseudoalteromonas sp. 2CM37A]|uniref:hypothetical protein n=1 Tax=Pseudoalteromonas sp. 2CM37A TaxID=2929853 RepID=UPI0020BEBF55|nr:hypothetical protein [Pseudoalteromonas sp. 2CM37A]MCK8115939.1 hypothetical protein [Pseudoalteromonas sp. 2CM37A]
MAIFTKCHLLLAIPLFIGSMSHATSIATTYHKNTDSKKLSVFDISSTQATKKRNTEIIDIYEDSIIYSVAQQDDGNTFREDIWFYDRNSQKSTPIGEKFNNYAPKVVNYARINGRKFIFNQLSENDRCELFLLEGSKAKSLLRDVSCNSSSLHINENDLYIAKTRFYYNRLQDLGTNKLYDRNGYNVDGILIHYNFATNKSQEIIHIDIGRNALPYVSEVIDAGSYVYTFQCEVKSGCKSGNYGTFNRYNRDFTAELTISRQSGDNLLHFAANPKTDTVYVYDENKLYGTNRLLVSRNKSAIDIIEDNKPRAYTHILGTGIIDEQFRLLNLATDTQLGETKFEMITFDDETQSLVTTEILMDNIVDTSSEISNNEAFIVGIQDDGTRNLSSLSLDGTIQHLFKFPVSLNYAIDILATDSNSILFSQNQDYWEFDRNSATLSEVELRVEEALTDRNSSLRDIRAFDFAGEKFFLIAKDNSKYTLWYLDSEANTLNQLGDTEFTDAFPEQSHNNILILKHWNEFITLDVNTKTFIQHEKLTGIKQITPIHFTENFTFISKDSGDSIKKWQYDWSTQKLEELKAYNNIETRYFLRDYIWFMHNDDIVYAYDKNNLTLYELSEDNFNTVFSAENQGITDNYKCENCVYKQKDSVYIFGSQWYYDLSSTDSGEINFYDTGEKKEQITNIFSYNEDLYFVPRSFNSIYKLDHDTEEVSNLSLKDIIGDKLISIPFSSALKLTSINNRILKIYDISKDFSNVSEIYSNNNFLEVSLSVINPLVTNSSKLVLNAEDAKVDNTYIGRELAVLNLYNYELSDILNEIPEKFELPNDEEFEFIPTVEQPNSLPLNFSLINSPDWLTVDEESGVLFGTPSVEDVGMVSNIKLIVDNGFENYTWNFSINIKASSDSIVEESRNGSGGSMGLLIYLILATLYINKRFSLNIFRK